MTNKPSSQREYSPEIVAKVCAFAANGSSPSHIASLLELKGNDRLSFFADITNVRHPLHKEYRKHKDINSDDVDATLNFLSLQGDTDAIDVAMKRETRDYIAQVKYDLFGI